MANRIHELEALITANIARFSKGIDDAVRKTESFRASWGRAARDVGSAATRITLAITGVGTAAAVSFAKYESVMIRAQAVTRTSGTAMGASLDMLARKMGEQTVFSATQAAQAIEQMGLAGLTTAEIHESLGGALQLAAAAQVDIATAADIAAKTMRAFGADASELTHINDVMVGTFTRANTDIRQLGEAFKPVAPISKALGVSLEDTAAAIAKMSDAGFQGSMAGTSLRNILSKLAGAAPEVTNRLRDLGITTLDSSGKMLPFLDILQQIEQQGITDAQILQLFGARGGPQLLALLEVGSQGIRQFSGELKGLQGITQEISDRNLESLSSQFALVLSKLNDLAIAAGETLKPALVELFQEATRWMTENKDAVVALATEGYLGLVNLSRDLIANMTELAPNLLRISAAMRELLVPVINLLAESPRLVQLLVILKGAQMFGVITAITSLGGAMVSTAMSVGKLATVLTAELAPIITSLGTTVLVRAQMAISGLAAAIMRDFIPSVLAAVLHAKALAGSMSWWQLGVAGGGVGLAIAGVAAFTHALMGLREEARRAQEQQDEFNRSVQAGLDLMNSDFNRKNNGANPRELRAQLMQQRRAAVERQRGQMSGAARAEQAIRDRSLLDRADQALRNFATSLPGMGGVEADPLRGEASVNREMAKATQRQIEMLDRQIAELDQRIGGQGRMQQWDPGAAGRAARRAGAAGGMTAGAGRGGMGGEIPAEGLGFDLQIQQQQAQADAAAAAAELQHRTQAANDTARRFGEALVGIQNNGELAALQVEHFANQAVDLRDDLISGHITLDEFSQSMMRLEDATRQAVDAARAEEEQKRREALLRGDFAGAGLDFRQALQDRVAQWRMQQFNGAVENAFNNMFGLNRAMAPVTQAFGTLGDRLGSVNTQMARGGMGGGGGRAPGAGQALGTLGAFLQSPGGQVANLRNQISMLQQNLGLVDTYRQRRRILDQIGQLESQIAAVSRPRMPVFGGVSGNLQFQDPGVQQSVNQVSLSFPNLTRMGNAEVAEMADRLQAELARRGRRL